MVTSVKEQHQKRRSSYRDGKTSHTKVYLVKTDDIADGTLVALTADDGTAAVPAAHSLLNPLDPTGPRVTGKDAQPIGESGKHFEVQVEYTIPTTSQKQAAENPMAALPEFNYSYTDDTEPYFLDRSDPPKPVTTSAGEPFEQFRERESGELIITMTRNESAHDAPAADAYSHTINDDTVTLDGKTYATGTLKISPIAAQTVTTTYVNVSGNEEEITYYRKTYIFKARRQGWDDKVLDVGLNELSAGKLKPILDAAGLPVKRPYPLNGSGAKKANPTDAPAELTFKPYEWKDWTGLFLF